MVREYDAHYTHVYTIYSYVRIYTLIYTSVYILYTHKRAYVPSCILMVIYSYALYEVCIQLCVLIYTYLYYTINVGSRQDYTNSSILTNP